MTGHSVIGQFANQPMSPLGVHTRGFPRVAYTSERIAWGYQRLATTANPRKGPFRYIRPPHVAKIFTYNV